MTIYRDNGGLSGLTMARALTGKPYVFGGTWPGSGGTDCDGLWAWAYGQIGVVVRRPTFLAYLDDIWDQRNGHKDDPNQPGDLLFIRGSDPGPNGEPGHVMGYVSPGRVFQAEMTGVPIGEFNADTNLWDFRCRPAQQLPIRPAPKPVPGSPASRVPEVLWPPLPLPVLNYRDVQPHDVKALYFLRACLNAAGVFPHQNPTKGDQYGMLTANRAIRWKRKNGLVGNSQIGDGFWKKMGAIR